MRKVRLSICLSLLLVFMIGTFDTTLASDFSYQGEAGPGEEPYLVSWQVPLIEEDGLKFKDLNQNGILDPYEDWRIRPEDRATDLVMQMSPEEKSAQLVHLTLYSPKEAWFNENNVGFALAYDYLSADPKTAAERVNELQQWSEGARLGIPLVISMDSVIGASWVKGATLYPDQIGLAATRDVELVRKLNAMQREEMMALGVRMSLSPIADLATEPRWGRFQECFGEDVNLATDMVVAAIEALQAGNELTADSVMVSVKHFPGSGPQENGIDGKPLLFDEETLALHLTMFEAAIEAGAASIMPYGYSTVPFLGGDALDKPAHESREVMTVLLKDEMGYTGLIQTDWGMRHVDAALAGAHILGGAGLREIPRLAEGIDPVELDAKVQKILEAKFRLGLFENPYVDPKYAEAVLGTEEHLALAYEAAAKSLTLLKNEFRGTLSGDSVVFVGGALANDADALNSGWKVPGGPGASVHEALTARVKEGAVHAFEDLDAINGGDAAIVVVGEAASTHQPPWGVANLEIPLEELDLIKTAKDKGLPVISVVVLSRPYVLTELVELSDAVLVVYRPGVSRGAEAIADALFGEIPIQGKLPIQLPRSLGEITEQREDLPFDLGTPLYDFGFGLEVSKFGSNN